MQWHLYSKGFVEGSHSDICLRCFEQNYALHRIILSRSSYFASLFSGPWADSSNSTLEIDPQGPSITKNSFEFVIRRLYDSNESVEEKEAISILATAAYMDIPELVEECVSVLILNIAPENIAERLKFAYGSFDYGEANERIAEACQILLCRDGYEYGLDIWDEVPINVVASVVKMDSFFVPNEFLRFTKILSLIESRYQKAKGFEKISESEFTLEIEPLVDAIRNGIHFENILFHELQIVMSERMMGTIELIPEQILHKALWTQVNFKSCIATTPSESLSSLLTTETETPYCIPSKDATFVGSSFESHYGNVSDENLRDSKQLYSRYAPARFSVKFSNVSALEDGRRLYSETFQYAGSSWNIYIQKATKGKRPQLGVYLHRTNSTEPSVTDLVNQLAECGISGNGEDGNPRLKIAEFAKAEQEQMKYLDKFRFVDDRQKTKTYFVIYTVTRPEHLVDSRRSREDQQLQLQVTKFCSAPDSFNLSQSWGWRIPHTDYGYGRDRDEIKFMVVLGHV